MINFSINGFGRIGRQAARAYIDRFFDQATLTAINTSGSLSATGWAHLLKYDTAYGIVPYQISAEDLKEPKAATDEDPLIGYITITKNNKSLKIPVLAQRDPQKIPWGEYGVTVVIESTGVFLTRELASQHLKDGVKVVVLSAPAKGEDIPTSVMGVNDKSTKHEKVGSYTIISNASCTTNSVAPVAQVMHQALGIKKAMLNTIHGYTDDQNLQDNSHKDLRRARAAALNIVPTSTGAAIATTQALPALAHLFDGISLRVPVLTGSISDFTFLTKRATSVDEINQIFIDAARLPHFKNILAVNEEPIVSSDIVGRIESAIVDLPLTRVVDGDLVKVMAWYDNEYGYANRLIEQVILNGQAD